jgi:hypothetical protein
VILCPDQLIKELGRDRLLLIILANKLELEVFRNFKFENKVMGLTLLVVSENIRIVIKTSFQVLGAIINKLIL